MTDIEGAGEHGDAGRMPRFERARESYGFACLRCGHTWEQTYDIERHFDREDQPYFLYYTGGERVPSPLNTLTCWNCGEHTVRITGTARVSAVRSAYSTPPPHRAPRHHH